jgi:hypothetical protein
MNARRFMNCPTPDAVVARTTFIQIAGDFNVANAFARGRPAEPVFPFVD